MAASPKCGCGSRVPDEVLRERRRQQESQWDDPNFVPMPNPKFCPIKSQVVDDLEEGYAELDKVMNRIPGLLRDELMNVIAHIQDLTDRLHEMKTREINNSWRHFSRNIRLELIQEIEDRDHTIGRLHEERQAYEMRLSKRRRLESVE